ncbi:hypothetical protein OEZ85_013303 [Tetradesmus obliquus]|uniref:Uncharacterized protein n=1 Tax=Tetradesmus obliquus TaxID=3088 RepID=A0ABY8U600_TETOB|nr:hypothetical protein OEZ85_013303 [Tetradesmus obliquus]
MSLSQHMFWRTALLLATVSLAAAVDCSSSRFNFFPEDRLNIPGGWNKANQTKAGNDCDGHLLPIAVQGIPKPLLHFLPVHSLLEPGAAVPAEAPAPVPAVLKPSSRMRQAKANRAISKQQAADEQQPSAVTVPVPEAPARNSNSKPAAAAAAEEPWRVTVPAEYEFTVDVNGKLWFKSKTFQGGNGIPEVNFNANVTEGRRDVFDPTIFQEGINTVVINVTVLQGTATISNGIHSAPAPRKDESFSSPPIDFFFFMNGNETHDSRPKADVTVNSCQPEISLELSNTNPQPVLLDGYRLTHTPTTTTQAFFLPVYYMYGSFLQGLDGSTDLQSDNTEGNVKNFGVYVTRLPNSPTKFNVSVAQMNWLREGWYSFTVEGAIWSPNSQYDNLMSVAGIDKFGNKHAEYLTVMQGGNVTDSISLYGGFKGAGWVLPQFNKTRVGVQRQPTWLNFFTGPETSITLGQRAAFSWEFNGLGNATCIINGVNPSNTTGMCTSPLVYPIVTTLNQTLMVNYTDVCAVTHSIGMTFGTFGWELQGSTVVSALGGSNTLALSDRGELAARRSSMNAAGAVSAAAWMHVTAAAAAVVFAALLL